MNLLKHLFLPHASNNHRPKLLHYDSLLIVAGVVFLATFLLSSVKQHDPMVLGAYTDISTQDLLLATNQQRLNAGLAPLVLNQQLSNAAYAKAIDMFKKNYWAHIAPDGTTPWDFIKATGYQYVYAGENLARGYPTPQDVVNAWMASPSHRANVLSKDYQDVGFAVQEDTLTGEKNTILVVEMFGGTKSLTAKPGVSTAFAETFQSGQKTNDSVIKNPIIDTMTFSKSISSFLLGLFIVLFILDLIVVGKKKVARLVGHNFDHILFFTAVLVFIYLMTSGVIS